MDPVNFFWVEEVGEMALAWLTLIGAAVGVRERGAFHPACDRTDSRRRAAA